MFLFPQWVIAAGLDMEGLASPKKEGIAILDPVTRGIYQKITECNKSSTYRTVQSSLRGVCETVKNSEFCSKVEESKRLNCNETETGASDIAGVVMGCIIGVFKTAAGFLKFLWTVLKTVTAAVLNIHKAGEALDTATEYMGMSQLYLHAEYENALKNVNPVFMSKEQAAALKVSKDLLKMLSTSIGGLISEWYQETGCMNNKAKAESICKVVGVLVIPPAGTLAILKYGKQGIKTVPGLLGKMSEKLGLTKSINSLSSSKRAQGVVEKFSQVRKGARLTIEAFQKAQNSFIQQAKSITGKRLTTRQKNALVKVFNFSKRTASQRGTVLKEPTVKQIQAVGFTKIEALRLKRAFQKTQNTLIQEAVVGTTDVLSSTEGTNFFSISARRVSIGIGIAAASKPNDIDNDTDNDDTDNDDGLSFVP